MSRDPGLDRWGTTHDGTFVACIVGTSLADRHEAIEILVRGPSPAAVVQRYQALGYHSIRFKGDHRRVPDGDEVVVLASDQEVLWRPFGQRGPWQPWPSGG